MDVDICLVLFWFAFWCTSNTSQRQESPELYYPCGIFQQAERFEIVMSAKRDQCLLKLATVYSSLFLWRSSRQVDTLFFGLFLCFFFSPRSDEPLILPLLKAGFDKVRLHTPFTKQLVHLWLVVFCYFQNVSNNC